MGFREGVHEKKRLSREGHPTNIREKGGSGETFSIVKL